ncbi:MAG: hypothetical protein ACK58Q_10705 [Chitinophagales bacterium]
MMENPNLEDDNKPKRRRIPKITAEGNEEILEVTPELVPEKVLIKLEEDPIAKKKPKKTKPVIEEKPEIHLVENEEVKVSPKI